VLALKFGYVRITLAGTTREFRSRRQLAIVASERSCKDKKLQQSRLVRGAFRLVSRLTFTHGQRGILRMRKTLVALIVITLSGHRVAAAQTSHEKAVALRIRSELDRAFAAKGDLAVAVRIQSALAKVTAARDEPGRSKDEVLRDAEYYLHGLYGAAAKDWQHIGPTLTAPVYNVIKWAALRCKDAGRPELEAWLRTNKNTPVSEPGGTIWAFRGLKDGWPIDGSREVPAQSAGNGLALAALNAIAPCTPVQPPKP
jgi:hypothetical protein